ncbi:MAG TPA: serine hydrolase [Thermoanaerobaculia bacterium]|nr:serine hydrolase [Thermoanaerobaculia bacterium]
MKSPPGNPTAGKRRPALVPARGAAVLAAALLLVACGAGGGETAGREAPADAPAPASFQPVGDNAGNGVAERPLASVERPGGDWTMVSPESHGLDAALLAEGVRRIGAEPGTRTLLVVHRGELVVEETFRGGRTDRPHNVKSVSKSLLGAAVGVALEQGVFTGLDQPLAELLPDALPAGEEGRRKGAITLRHLLTQTPGLEPTSGEHYGAWVSSRNWVRAALARPLLSPPGEDFRYSTGNTHLLSAALARAAGTTSRAFLEEHVAGPIGLDIADWARDPQGVHLGGNELSTTPRDLARFALLALGRGRWGERQVVPEDWMQASLGRQTETTPEWQERYGDYGYLWWIPRTGTGSSEVQGREVPGREAPSREVLAAGYAGQFVWLVPEADLAVILTSDHQAKGAAWDERVLATFRDHVLAAVPAG